MSSPHIYSLRTPLLTDTSPILYESAKTTPKTEESQKKSHIMTARAVDNVSTALNNQISDKYEKSAAATPEIEPEFTFEISKDQKDQEICHITLKDGNKKTVKIIHEEQLKGQTVANKGRIEEAITLLMMDKEDRAKLFEGDYSATLTLNQSGHRFELIPPKTQFSQGSGSVHEDLKTKDAAAKKTHDAHTKEDQAKTISPEDREAVTKYLANIDGSLTKGEESFNKQADFFLSAYDLKKQLYNLEALHANNVPGLGPKIKEIKGLLERHIKNQSAYVTPKDIKSPEGKQIHFFTTEQEKLKKKILSGKTDFSPDEIQKIKYCLTRDIVRGLISTDPKHKAALYEASFIINKLGDKAFDLCESGRSTFRTLVEDILNKEKASNTPTSVASMIQEQEKANTPSFLRVHPNDIKQRRQEDLRKAIEEGRREYIKQPKSFLEKVGIYTTFLYTAVEKYLTSLPDRLSQTFNRFARARRASANSTTELSKLSDLRTPLLAKESESKVKYDATTSTTTRRASTPPSENVQKSEIDDYGRGVNELTAASEKYATEQGPVTITPHMRIPLKRKIDEILSPLSIFKKIAHRDSFKNAYYKAAAAVIRSQANQLKALQESIEKNKKLLSPQSKDVAETLSILQKQYDGLLVEFQDFNSFMNKVEEQVLNDMMRANLSGQPSISGGFKAIQEATKVAPKNFNETVIKLAGVLKEDPNAEVFLSQALKDKIDAMAPSLSNKVDNQAIKEIYYESAKSVLKEKANKLNRSYDQDIKARALLQEPSPSEQGLKAARESIRSNVTERAKILKEIDSKITSEIQQKAFLNPKLSAYIPKIRQANINKELIETHESLLKRASGAIEDRDRPTFISHALAYKQSLAGKDQFKKEHAQEIAKIDEAYKKESTPYIQAYFSKFEAAKKIYEERLKNYNAVKQTSVDEHTSTKELFNDMIQLGVNPKDKETLQKEGIKMLDKINKGQSAENNAEGARIRLENINKKLELIKLHEEASNLRTDNAVAAYAKAMHEYKQKVAKDELNSAGQALGRVFENDLSEKMKLIHPDIRTEQSKAFADARSYVKLMHATVPRAAPKAL